ncbi:sodium:calcium antiporter [Candidatus Micrarchaeota archaeon]|nr:sodium:calcium antiporter [Candidatus Micrarchaeota archaeon]MBU1165328.1 sodium:calcium antiporter [Candidatus Micrarchaeota archaeon]MBU1886978.1 sodium:calcium antiporter [Candidatus Micrarchaeota archaeon]
MILADLIILAISMLVLSNSASLVVQSSLKLSSYFNISQIAIGFLLIAISTSLPELSLSVTSSIAGEGALSAGDVFGSNTANILLILGIGAFFYNGIKISEKNLREIGIILLLTTLISVYIIYSSAIEKRGLGFFEGIILLSIFAVYVYGKLKKKNHLEEGYNGETITKKMALNAFVMFCSGVIAIIISSAFVVSSAISISEFFGIAHSFIGATIIAIGTSLPELSTTIYALKNKHYGIVLGNIAGSNITNLGLVFGVALSINPIMLHLPVFIATLLFAVAANTILFYAAAVNKGIGRIAGAIFLLIFIVYLITIFGLQLNELAPII